MDNTVHFINTYPPDGDLSTPERALFALETIKPWSLEGFKKIYEDSSEIPGLNSVWHHLDYNKRQKGLMQEF